MLARDSLELLRAALFDARFADLFDLDVYGAILGMFELNNMGESIRLGSLISMHLNCQCSRQ